MAGNPEKHHTDRGVIRTNDGKVIPLRDTVHVEELGSQDGYRQLVCAILYRAVQDLDSSNKLRAEKARQWLQSPYAADLADMSGVIHPDHVVAFAKSR